MNKMSKILKIFSQDFIEIIDIINKNKLTNFELKVLQLSVKRRIKK